MTKNDRTSSFADITILVSKSDNGAEYRCEATNPTLKAPLTKSVELTVYCKSYYVDLEILSYTICVRKCRYSCHCPHFLSYSNVFQTHQITRVSPSNRNCYAKVPSPDYFARRAVAIHPPKSRGGVITDFK